MGEGGSERAGIMGRVCLLLLCNNLHALHDVIGDLAVEVLAGRGTVGGGLGGHSDSISGAVGRRGGGGARRAVLEAGGHALLGAGRRGSAVGRRRVGRGGGGGRGRSVCGGVVAGEGELGKKVRRSFQVDEAWLAKASVGAHGRRFGEAEGQGGVVGSHLCLFRTM